MKDQLCRLHYSPGSLKAVKARLKTLVTHGYLHVSSAAVKHATPERQFYSARYYYTLAPAGVRYLVGLELDVEAHWRPHHEADKHGLFVDHTLAVNDVLIAAALLHRVDARFALESFIHEHVLKQRPYPVTLPEGHSSSVIPDVYLDFRLADRRAYFPVLLELDRATEERAHFKRKVAAYVAFIKAWAFEGAFGRKGINIAFATFHGEAHRDEMRTWTQQVLEG